MSRQLQKLFPNKIIASHRVLVVIYLMSVVGQVSSKEPCKKNLNDEGIFTHSGGMVECRQGLEELEWALFVLQSLVKPRQHQVQNRA